MLDIPKQNDFLIAFDSDGCVFDTMELKHKECFIPQIINHYGLQAVSKYAREAAEFVNLYSKSRGINRFPALIEALEWLQKRPEVNARGKKIEIPASLRGWVKNETKLGNPALEAKVQETNDPELKKALVWSKAVNASVDAMVRDVPPFPFVEDVLKKIDGKADVIVCSATPNKNLQLEWSEHKLDGYVALIAGQEVGTKKEILTHSKHYDKNKTLMVGDAPGDYAAAKANDCLYFPINPGDEEASWEELFKTGIDKFFAGTFAGDYQKQLLDKFESYLPEKPKWKVVG